MRQRAAGRDSSREVVPAASPCQRWRSRSLECVLLNEPDVARLRFQAPCLALAQVLREHSAATTTLPRATLGLIALLISHTGARSVTSLRTAHEDATGARDRMPLRAIFSDLDGTLVHFSKWFEEHGTRIVSMDEASGRAVVESPTGERRDCRLLPSSTMGPGLVSEASVDLVAALR